MHKTSEWLQSFSTPNSPEVSRKKQSLDSFSPCRKVSVTGGKGGVGKTSVALKMARELAHSGARTLLIDCDFNLSNTAIKLGLPLGNHFEQLLSAEKSFEECLIQQGNFHLLPACNGSEEVFSSRLRFEDIIGDILRSHEHEYDWILLDCPAGLSREALSLNALCDQRIVVVTPDKSSVTDSYSLIKLLHSRFGVTENHLLVNMYQNDRQFQKVVLTLTETVRNFLGCETFVLGGLPKLDVPAGDFDTFFLSDAKNEFNRNFVKLLYGFTETAGGPSTAAASRAAGHLAQEHDVH
jgi:flagellar biosynthesis protein FlhG